MPTHQFRLSLATMFAVLAFALGALVFSGESARADSLCPPGFYGDDGSADCTPASPGHYVDVAGATSEIACAVGSYQPNSAAIFCNLASAGSYVDTTGAVATTLCPAGSYQPSFGASSCLLADPGYSVSFDGQVAQQACSPGKYQPSSGAIACLLAPIGSYVDTTGAAAAALCPAGSTTSATGSDSVLDCDVLVDADGDGIPNVADQCPASNLSPTVVIGGIDTGVPNHVLSNGCSIADLVAQAAAGATNHGQFVSAVAKLTNDLKKAGAISGQQKGAIQSAAARASLP